MTNREMVFYKMVASGNDFVVFDNRQGQIKNVIPFAQKVCTLHTGIGADGILLFENSKKADFKMRIVNSDGSEAEACGNGFRCISLYAHQIMNYPEVFRFESLSGIIEAKILANQRIQVELVQPSEYIPQASVKVMDRSLNYSFINTGVPHAVILVEGIDKMEVETLGRAIREHKQFQPRGTNVNFVQINGNHEIQVRTYERGVEKETLACGTGSTASAVISSLLGYTQPPVKVQTSGGEILTIDFKKNGKNVESVTLEGEAHFVFEGKIKL